MPLSRAKSWFFTGFWVRLHVVLITNVVLLPASKNRKENHLPTPSPQKQTRSASGKRQASTRLWEPSRLPATKDLTRLWEPSRSLQPWTRCSEGKLPGPRKAFKAASNGGKLPGLRKVRRLLRFTGNLLGGYFRLPGDLFALSWQSARSSSSSLTGKKPVAAAYLVTAVISLTSGDSSGHG